MTEVDPLTTGFARSDPPAFARVLGRGTTTEIMPVLLGLAPDVVATVLAQLSLPAIEEILADKRSDPQHWLSVAPTDDAVALIGRIPRKLGVELCDSLVDRERRRRLLRHLKYPSHSVGSLARDVVVRISADLSGKDCLDELRRLDLQDPGPIAVLASDSRYMGLLNLWSMLRRDPPAGSVRDHVVAAATLFPETSLINATRQAAWAEHNWLPVVDHDGRLIGGVQRREIFSAAKLDLADVAERTDMLATVFGQLIRAMSQLLQQILLRKRAS